MAQTNKMIMIEVQEILTNLSAELRTQMGINFGSYLCSLTNPFNAVNHKEIVPGVRSELGLKKSDLIKDLSLDGKLSLTQLIAFPPENASALNSASQQALAPESILPLSAFRWGAARFFCGSDFEKIFFSSGTTQITKAQSPFSRDGLILYKMGSLLTFSYVLADLGFSSIAAAPGISWIPSSTAWPKSSLARMLSWFSEYYPVSFAEAGTLPDFLMSPSDKPVWLFATAYDLINEVLQNPKGKPKLPPGSLVFETGGTKGRTVELNKEEFYSRLAERFGICADAIVSEYGMGELASQAYDWKIKDSGSHERGLKFPVWVQTFLSVPASSKNDARDPTSKWQGILCVKDHLRIDYPFVLRTSDVVKGNAKTGTFTYLKRSAFTPLKGCSLNAEELSLGESATPAKKINNHFELLELSSAFVEGMIRRSTIIKQNLGPYLQSKEFFQLLFQEFFDPNISEMAQKDLCELLPRSIFDWLHATLVSISISLPGQLDFLKAREEELFSGEIHLATSKIYAFLKDPRQSCIPPNTPLKWLLIGPSSHSIALIEPIIFAFICGLDISVRTSSRNSSGLIARLISFLGSLDRDFTKTCRMHSKKTRLNLNTAHGYDRMILLFGGSETLRLVNHLGLNCKGFGNYLTGSILVYAEKEDFELLIKDAISLGQRGCFSSRFAIILTQSGMRDLDHIVQSILQIADSLITASLPGEIAYAVEDERLRYTFYLGFKAFFSPLKKFLLPVISLDDFSKNFLREGTANDLWLSQAPFTLPLVIGKAPHSTAEIIHLITQLQMALPDFQQIAVNNRLLQEINLNSHEMISSTGLRISLGGTTNFSQWTGLHQNQSYYKS